MRRQSGGHDRPREARLLAGAAHLYPGVTPGIWIQAASMADVVWAQRLRRGEGGALRDRILNPDHFEFRLGGTVHTESELPRRRATDRLRLHGD
jgi:hypothetical protein